MSRERSNISPRSIRSDGRSVVTSQTVAATSKQREKWTKPVDPPHPFTDVQYLTKHKNQPSNFDDYCVEKYKNQPSNFVNQEGSRASNPASGASMLAERLMTEQTTESGEFRTIGMAVPGGRFLEPHEEPLTPEFSFPAILRGDAGVRQLDEEGRGDRPQPHIFRSNNDPAGDLDTRDAHHMHFLRQQMGTHSRPMSEERARKVARARSLAEFDARPKVLLLPFVNYYVKRTRHTVTKYMRYVSFCSNVHDGFIIFYILSINLSDPPQET